MLKFKKAADFKDVIYEKSGYVARITLNKPEALNTGVKDMGKAMELAAEADDIKVLIFKGGGPRFSRRSPPERGRFRVRLERAEAGEKAPQDLKCGTGSSSTATFSMKRH